MIINKTYKVGFGPRVAASEGLGIIEGMGTYDDANGFVACVDELLLVGLSKGGEYNIGHVSKDALQWFAR